jgi:hypothetical protein
MVDWSRAYQEPWYVRMLYRRQGATTSEPGWNTLTQELLLVKLVRFACGFPEDLFKAPPVRRSTHLFKNSPSHPASRVRYGPWPPGGTGTIFGDAVSSGKAWNLGTDPSIAIPSVELLSQQIITCCSPRAIWHQGVKIRNIRNIGTVGMV